MGLVTILCTLVKVKRSRNKSWTLGGKMEFWAFMLALIFGKARTVQLSALRPGHALPLRKFLVPVSVRGCAEPRAT
jgi:hypothetical protein